MLFNSLSFLIFLPIVFAIYWIIGTKKRKLQNLALLLASFYFYACWDWRFLFLLMFSICLDYYTGIKIDQAKMPTQRKMWMLISVCVNLGFLMFFKYLNFFVESLVESLNIIGYHPDIKMLNIILPIGISFYTFHGLSYIFDIYNHRISSEKNFIDYALFVSFFPLLVAGPIERATHLLPQIKKKRTFNYANSVDGLKQILWGLFKKIAVADLCATFVNDVFANYQHYGSIALTAGAVMFAIQIYCDFSGYTDIALGTARLFGIELLQNFSFPYFSRNIAEFWRRWHISLSSWFRDYLYIPIGGSKVKMIKKIRNIFTIFVVSGFWHGANWTFIAWGTLHAMCYIPDMLLKRNRKYTDVVAQNTLFPSIREFFNMITTFAVVCLAWIFFRADNLNQAYTYIQRLFAKYTNTELPHLFKPTLICIAILFIIEWIGRRNKHALQKIFIRQKTWIRWSFYYAIILCILIGLLGGNAQDFIYFQF